MASQAWVTDPDGTSGCPTSLSGTPLTSAQASALLPYCQKWYPRTTGVDYQTTAETITFWTAGNQAAYATSVLPILCLQPSTTPNPPPAAVLSCSDVASAVASPATFPLDTNIGTGQNMCRIIPDSVHACPFYVKYTTDGGASWKGADFSGNLNTGGTGCVTGSSADAVSWFYSRYYQSACCVPDVTQPPAPSNDPKPERIAVWCGKVH